MNVERNIKEMNDYYEKRSSIHDTYMSYTSNENMEKLLGSIIKLFEKGIIGKNVLEIACGTGNWTQVLAKRAYSVLATDFSEASLELARSKDYENAQVHFEKADAYNLENIEDTFNVAFAADWWSHMPKSMITGFLTGLHNKLEPGSLVIFIDMMQNDMLVSGDSYYDDDGNFIHKRTLPDGQSFDIIKNFPTELELKRVAGLFSNNIRYYENFYLERCLLSYCLI